MELKMTVKLPVNIIHDQTHGMAQSKQVEKDLASCCHTLFSRPQKDNIAMLPTIENIFARSLTWVVNSLFVTCHMTQASNNESVPRVRKK